MIYLPLVLLAFSVAGCGSSDGLYEVSGQVTYQGKPVPSGYIKLIPDTSKGNSGPGGGAEIVDGTYRTPSGKGVVGGPYIVEIVGTDGVPYTESGEEIPDGKPLFKAYETTFDFPKETTVKDFEVPDKVPPKARPGQER